MGKTDLYRDPIHSFRVILVTRSLRSLNHIGGYVTLGTATIFGRCIKKEPEGSLGHSKQKTRPDTPGTGIAQSVRRLAYG
jgi:hypothetical protein